MHPPKKTRLTKAQKEMQKIEEQRRNLKESLPRLMFERKKKAAIKAARAERQRQAELRKQAEEGAARAGESSCPVHRVAENGSETEACEYLENASQFTEHPMDNYSSVFNDQSLAAGNITDLEAAEEKMKRKYRKGLMFGDRREYSPQQQQRHHIFIMNKKELRGLLESNPNNESIYKAGSAIEPSREVSYKQNLDFQADQPEREYLLVDLREDFEFKKYSIKDCKKWITSQLSIVQSVRSAET